MHFSANGETAELQKASGPDPFFSGPRTQTKIALEIGTDQRGFLGRAEGGPILWLMPVSFFA